MVSLGEVAVFSSGGTPSRKRAEFFEGTIPWITGADIQDGGVINARSFITDEAVRGSSTQIAPGGSIALVTRTSVGKTAQFVEPTAFSQDITVLQPRPGYDARYVMHFLRERAAFLKSEARGATIQGVTKSVVASLVLPDLPVAEQRRIASILDHADALRAKRREQLAVFAALEVAEFNSFLASVEPKPMDFGDLATDMRNGLSPSARGAIEGRVLTLSAVTKGRFDVTASRDVLFDRAPASNQRVVAGSFLLSRGNGNRDLVAVGVFPEDDHLDIAFPDTVIAAAIDETLITPEYLSAVWRTPRVRRQLEAGMRTTNGTFKVNQRVLERVQLPVPPIEAQRRFSRGTRERATAAASIRRSLGQLDTLFASLQHRAFRGEL